MQRTIVSPAILSAAALAELKLWLAITSAGEDDALTRLLASALELCEAFTGQLPLEADCEEIWPADPSDWQVLATRPVQAITRIDGIPADGARFTLSAAAYAIELDADGGGRFRILSQGAAGRIAVRFTAGLAPDWDSLPDALRQGVLRLAAHLYRARDDDAAGAMPPAAVAALWRPWRRYRLR